MPVDAGTETVEPTIPLDEPQASGHWRAGMWALGGLTAVAAALRFWDLSHPVLWGDEVATYWRVSGSFERLMSILHNQGFVPLHYITYWLLRQVTRLTPVTMRLIPAVMGVIFVPAMYLLARQMFSRRTALLAAALAATSAYGMTYSRDAKMYMQTWCMVTLFLGLLLMWWRTKRGWLWPLWVVTGAAATLWHATAMIPIGLVPLMLAAGSGKFRKRDVPLLAVGMLLVFAAPAWYYLVHNKFLERTRILPLQTLETDESDWNHSGLDWIEHFNEGQTGWQLTLNSAASYIAGVQWPRQRIDPGGFHREQQPWFTTAVTITMTALLGILALGAWPWPRRWRGGHPEQSDGDPDPPVNHPDTRAQPTWRAWYWLAIWLVLPTYGVFYCRSYNEFASPAVWLTTVWQWLGWGWLAAVAAIAALSYIAALRRWSRVVLILAWGAGLGTTVGLAIERDHLNWATVWLDMVRQPWVLWPLVIAGPAAWLATVGPTWRGRLIALAQVAGVTAVVLVLCTIAWFIWHKVHLSYVERHEGVGWQSIWMPRYLGIAFPAVLVGCAALLMRLPTRPLRWLAIVAFIGVNLTQGLARLIVETEPPFDRVGADVWQAHEEPTMLAVLTPSAGEKRWHWFGGWRAEFYLCAAAGQDQYDAEGQFREFRLVGQTRVMRQPHIYRLRRMLTADPAITTLVVWDRFAFAVPPDQALKPSLPREWVECDQQIHRTRQFWTWRDGWWYRRLVYKRNPPEPAVD